MNWVSGVPAKENMATLSVSSPTYAGACNPRSDEDERDTGGSIRDASVAMRKTDPILMMMCTLPVTLIYWTHEIPDDF
jgi:hypothetical protein